MADNWTPPSDAEVVDWTPPSDAQTTDEPVKKKVVTTPSESTSQDGAKVLSDVSEQFRKAGTQGEKPLSESGTSTKKLVEDTPTYEDKQSLSTTDIANEKKRLEKMPTSESMLLESGSINAISSDIVRNKNISEIASQDPNVLKLNSLILERDKAIQANEGQKVADLSSEIESLKKAPADNPIDLQQQLQQHNLQYQGAPQDTPQEVSGFKPQTLNDRLVANKAKPVKTVGELHDLSNEAQKKVSELQPELDKIKIPFDEQVAQIRKENQFKSTEENGVRKLEGIADAPEAFVMGARNTFKDGLGMLKQVFGTKEDRQNYSDQRALEDGVLFPTETKGGWTSGAEMAGGVAPYIATGALGGETILGQILSNGLTMGATGIGSAYHQEYQKQKALGLSKDDADKIALEKSAFHGGTQAVLGGSLPFLGGASKSILMHPKDLKLLEQFAEESALGKPYAYNAKNMKASLKGFGSEMGGIQTAFAGEHIANNAFDKYVLGDKKKNLLEGTADVIMQGSLLHLGMHVLPSVPKAIKDIYDVNFSKRYPSIQQAVDMAMQEGKITKEQADAITVPLRQKYAIYNAMPEGLTAEQMVSIKPETEQILELSKKEPSAVENPDITKDRIAQLQKTIAEKLGTPLTEKEQKSYEKLQEIKADKEDKLTPSEKSELKHYENRIATAENEKAKQAEEKKAEKETATETIEEKGVEEPKEEVKAEVETPTETIQEKGGEEGKSDADIEKRMLEIQDKKVSFDSPEQKEFNALEKEMEKRERNSVFNVPLEKVGDAVDALRKKDKEQPNGYGSFIEVRDARETKEVADRYLNAKELTDEELKKDFSDAVRGNPTTWYADGLKLRESLKEATNRGINTKKMLERVTNVYTDAGYDIETAKSVVAGMLEPILKSSKKVEQPIVAEKLVVENKEVPKIETKVDFDGNEIGSKSYQEKKPTQLVGREREKVVADGTKIKGTYKVVSADDVIASHNEETFSKEKGFPTKDGKTINDRDYEKDNIAQQEVVRIANELDQRAVAQTPIVTKEGVVIDGNNRTMSRKLAAKQGTDKAYLDALQSESDMYGIDPNEISKIKNPMLVFEPTEDLPYTTETLKRFNVTEKKEKSTIEKAVEISKTISDKVRSIMNSIYDNADRPSDITSDPKAMADIRKTLIDAKIWQPNEIAKYINAETGTATKSGVEFLETLLMGSSLDENTIRMLNAEGMGNARNMVLKSIVPLTKNSTMGENSLTPNIAKGIELLNQAKNAKSNVLSMINQLSIFEQAKYSAEDLALATLLESGGLKKFLNEYNSKVGTNGLFGEITKSGEIDEFLRNEIKNYEQIRSNLRINEPIAEAELPKGDGVVKQEIDNGIKEEAKPKGEPDEKPKSEGSGEGGKSDTTTESKGKQLDKAIGQGEVSLKQKALDRLAEAKRKRDEFIDKKNNLGSSKDAFSEAEEQAKIDRELFDAYVNTAKEYIKEGVKSAKEWAEAIGEELTDTIKKAWDEANAGNKKRVLTERAYEGEVRDDVKAYLEKKGLYREKFTQEERKTQAKEYIAEFGEEMALESVKYGEAKGALAAAILTETQKSINAERLKLKNTDTVKLDELAQKEADIISILGEYAYEGGEFNAYLDKVYKEDVDLGYSYEKKVKEWKDLNGGEISPEVEAKFKDLDNKMQELKKKLADAEVKLKEEKEKQSFEDIKESVKRKPSKSDVIESKKAKAKADIGEALNEISDVLGIKLSAVGDKRAELTKALVKLGKGLIDLGEANAQNVVEKIKERVERQFKGKVNFDEHEKNLIDAFEKERPKAILKNGKLVIPDKLIRNLVENGIDNIEDLTKSIKDIISDEMPDITDREIRDAITKYGKVINPPKDTVSKQIGKIKDIGRILSQLEDISNKKRPLKSGLQRDKFDAEQRAKHKELREALKELPLDDEALANEIRSIQDTKKARLQNRIEDLQREIDTKTKTEKSKKNIEDDAEIKQLREQLESVKAEHDKEFADQNEAEKEAKRLNTAKKNAQRRIEDLQRKLREGDFSKAEKKPIPIDEEVTKLKAEKLRIQEEYDKEFHKNQLQNRTKWEVAKDHVWELWGITRALRATGEMSYVGVQGLVQTIAHPMIAARAFKNSIKFMASEQHTENWLRELKTQEYYPTLKESKLSISEPNAELSAREELFYSGWTNILWDSIGTPLKLKSKEAYDKWVSANPMKAIERGAVGYLDTIRVERFLDGMEMLQAQGKTIENDKASYKNMADVINTFTGRASLGAMEQIAPQLSKVFFSPRNWASALKTTLLLPIQIAKWQNGELKPTVANKMAISDLSKFMGTTTGMVMMASVALNNDDRDDTYVETDPRSSDFGKIRIGDIRIDPWGGKIQQIVLASRLITEEVKSTTTKDIKDTSEWGTSTRSDLMIEQAANKLSPSAGMLYKYLSSRKSKNGGRVDVRGKEYSPKDDFLENLTPIYWGSTVPELLKDDPSALNGILAFYAFFGGGVNVYGKKEAIKK